MRCLLYFHHWCDMGAAISWAHGAKADALSLPDSSWEVGTKGRVWSQLFQHGKALNGAHRR